MTWDDIARTQCDSKTWKESGPEDRLACPAEPRTTARLQERAVVRLPPGRQWVHPSIRGLRLESMADGFGWHGLAQSSVP